MGDWKAWVVDLDSDPEIVWKNVSSKCRDRIREGRRNGFVVENCEDPAFVYEYYSQVKEVYARKKLSLPFPITVIRNLHKHLMPDKLFALRVKHGNESAAPGMFIHDHHMVSSFEIASRAKYLYLCPNDLLNWSLMSRAGKMGLRQFVIGHDYRLPKGLGQFRKKFKCRLVSVYRYSETYSTIAKVGHELFKRMYSIKQETNKLFSTKGPCT